MSDDTLKTAIPHAQKWECSRCRALLGYVNRERTELRIKHKDSFVWIESPRKVTVPCRRCATMNSVTASDLPQD